MDGASLGSISAEVADWTAAGALVGKLTDESLKKVQFASGEDVSGEYADMTLITPVQVTPGTPALLTFGIRERTEEEIQQADVQTAISYLSDEQALTVKDLYADWNENGVGYIAGDRVQYNGKLYKCLQGHTSQADWPLRQRRASGQRSLQGRKEQKSGNGCSRRVQTRIAKATELLTTGRHGNPWPMETYGSREHRDQNLSGRK